MSAQEHLSPDQFRNQVNPAAVEDTRLHAGKYLIKDEGNGFITAHRVNPQQMVLPNPPDVHTGKIRNDYWDKDSGEKLPAPRRAGELSFHAGKSERDATGTPTDQLPMGHPGYNGSNGGVISAVRVPKAHQRKGVAGAMLDLARENYGEVRHSQVLSDEGAAWRKARP